MRSVRWIAAVTLAFVGCGSTARKPLFTFDSTPTKPPKRAQPEPAPAPRPAPLALEPARPLRVDPAPVESVSATREEIAVLVARLRGGRAGERKAVLEKLVLLGEPARTELGRALEDAAFEADVLQEAIGRIRDKEHPEQEDRKHGVASSWVEAKYRLALEKFLAGDDLGAQQLVDAILTVEPATTARPRLERLRSRIRDHLIAETVISSTIVPEDAVLTPGKKLRAKILLENKSREEVTLKASPGSPLGQVVLEYEELESDGTRALRRTTRAVRAAEAGLKLASHARLELELDLPTEHGDKRKSTVGRYRLSGRLRPYTLLAGEEPLPYFLPLQAIEVVVLDDDDKEAGEKPAEKFAAALEAAKGAKTEADREKSQRTAFAAALVWASASRDAAVAAIVKALEPAEGSLARMLGAALARALGEPGSYTKEEWLAWWRSGASRPRSLRPGDDEDR